MACVAAAAQPVGAVNWDGGGVNSEWIEPANWEFNMIPNAGQVATIVNDTATITGVTAPPVLAVELGLGSAPGGLVMSATSAPAVLNVVSNVAVASAGALTVGGGGPGTSQLIAGSLSTAGDVALLPRGTLMLSGQLTQTAGTVALTGGTLNVANVVSQAGLLNAVGTINGNASIGDGVGAEATLSPGAGIGMLNVNGNLKLASDARLAVQFRATGGAGVVDAVNVSGTLTLGGTLDLSILGPGQPTPGAVYPILTAGTVDPDHFFDEIVGLPAANGSWVPMFDSLSNGFNVTFTMTRGDMNGDLAIDEYDVEKFAWAIRDAFTYRERFINIPPPPEACLITVCGASDEYMADMDLDGDRTFADIPMFLDAIQQNGGNAAAAFVVMAKILQGVPEPCAGSLGLAAVAVLAHAARRRRTGRTSP